MKKLVITLIIVMTLIFMGVPALAGDKLIPGGPSTEGNLNFESHVTYSEMIKILDQIEKTSKGRVEVFTLDKYGRSEAGRSLYVAKIGNGDKKIWIQARIHGDEQLVTEAVLQVLKELGTKQTDFANKVLDQFTIYAIPIYNPDGSELNQRGTQIIDDETGEIVHKNFDLNRDWKVNLKGEGYGFVADESEAYYAFWCDIKPDFALDMHHQGIKKVHGTDESTSMSLGVSLSPNGPTLPGLGNDRYNYNDVTRQMHVYIYDRIKDYGYTHVDRYQIGGNRYEIDIYGGVVSGMMLGINHKGLNADHHSCPAIFLETKGQTDILGQRSNGYLTKQNYHALKAFLYGLATGEVFEQDPDRWNEIPHNPDYDYYTDYAGIIAR